ncbi:MAG TPA: hypothetical protein VIH76_16025 [Candidatus Acidoferrales bacterium]
MAKKKAPKKKARAKKAQPKKSAKKAEPRKPIKKAAQKKTAKRVVARAAAPSKKAARGKTRPGKLYGMGRVGVAPTLDERAEIGGQSGDVQGLSKRESVDSESVEELVEEGQAFEAEVVEGVEDAPDADVSEVKTHEVPEDDVPSEYDEKQSDV